MKTEPEFLKVVFIAIFLGGFYSSVLADNGNGVISRPVIGYSSGDLRDPFRDLLQVAEENEKKKKETQEFDTPASESEQSVPVPSLEKFKVQGIIWGGRFPQAIVNNKMVVIGDTIEGFKVVNIEKKGVTLSFSGKTAILSAPGISSSSEKDNKEEK
jgi:hypothetical protein